MAKVATLQINGSALTAGTMKKRKTPSELRGEQLKRTNNVVEVVDESPAGAPFLASTNTNVSDTDNNGVKKPELCRNPRYIDTRMDDVFPAKKSRLRMFSTKENTKENVSTERPGTLKNLSVLSNLATKRQQLSCSPEDKVASAQVSKDGTTQTRQTIQKCSQSIFRSVTDLSSSGEKSTGLTIVDMDKALKGLVANEPPASTGLTGDGSEKIGNNASTYLGNFCSECHVPGQKAPLDFTLKTKMTVASSCSVNWIHRSIMGSTYNGMPQFTSQVGFPEERNTSGQALTSQILSSKALHSWVYPQSVLPSSVISVLISSAADGGFLRQRQLAWEDSFRSLYYMLRKNICNIFYVCTSHFVVLFTSSDGFGKSKQSCNAYISQSTRGLRSLLREHDVSFSMPLCHSKEVQVATEDLVELSEIEKQNLGQIRRQNSLSDDDNSPQSLLAFLGNKNVHGLYDFLLNYRSSLTFLSGVDVPALYSPVPFQNAALSAPQIRCVEIKRTDHCAASNKESTLKKSTCLRSSLEIKDAYIPSWIICRICALMGSEGRTFEASFTTERTSIGLNVALGTLCENLDSNSVGVEGLKESSDVYGISEAVITPSLRSGFLKGLKYNDGSYTASLSPV